MMAPTAWRPSGRNPSLQSNPSACIAFTISNATGKLSIVAARCDMGVLLLWAWQPQLEYPFLPLTQNLLRHPLRLPLDAAGPLSGYWDASKGSPVKGLRHHWTFGPSGPSATWEPFEPDPDRTGVGTGTARLSMDPPLNSAGTGSPVAPSYREEITCPKAPSLRISASRPARCQPRARSMSRAGAIRMCASPCARSI